MMSSARVIPTMMGQARSTAWVKACQLPASVSGFGSMKRSDNAVWHAAGFAVVPSDHAVYLPENTNFAEAACGSRDDSSPLRLCRRFCAGTNYFSDGGRVPSATMPCNWRNGVEQRRSQP